MKKYIVPIVVIGLLAGIALPLLWPAKRASAPEPSQTGESSIAQQSDAANAASTNNFPANSTKGESAKVEIINPYAGALKEPGDSKRAWDVDFIKRHQDVAIGDPIEFELTEGRMAKGVVRITQYREGQLSYFSGTLDEPETGEFFFLTPPQLGVAGKAVGVIRFPGSSTAYRIEPTGTNGDPELWKRRLDEVICIGMPKPMAAAEDADETMEITPVRPDEVPSFTPSYNSNIVSLQSLPGATGVLLLDFAGGYTPTWGGVYYSKPSGINDYRIRDIWKRVAEDYMPFKINVTTDFQVYSQAPETSRQRVAFTDTPVTAAGVAFYGSWNWGGDTPCWSVYSSGKNAAEVASHEAGHTLNLSHQGQWNGVTTYNEYYGGHGSGEVGWAPIMGVGYGQPVAQWAKGEYTDANQTEDELNRIINPAVNNNTGYRTDDTGNTLATSRYLEINPDNSVSGEGVIETTGDTDSFQFTTTGGLVSLTARPVEDWANLAMSVTLANNVGTIIASSNPSDTLWARVDVNLAAGTYTFSVKGVGRNNPLNSGFSDYASLGYYSIVGYVTGARQPTRLSVMEKVPNSTVVGTVPPNAAGNLTYSIASGNEGSTFSINSSGVLSVANNTLVDYQKRSTNAFYFAGFELFVNIVNNDNALLTELNRRVVVTVLDSTANNPIDATGYNAGIIVPYNATTATPQATGFDIPNNWAFYQEGLNANAQINSSGDGLNGLPADRIIRSQADNTIFQLGPYGGTNALMMGNNAPYSTTGTLVLTTPQAFNRLSILASSANGGGLGTLVLNYTNGTKSQVFNFNAQDWYNVTTNTAIEGFGRVKLGLGTFDTEDPGWDNPNLYSTTIDLASLGQNLMVSSITFTNPPVGGSRSTAVLGISGQAMPSAVAIAVQPASTTNSVPASSAVFSVAAMGSPTLRYQWYFGNPGSGALLSNQTNTSLTLSSPQLGDAGNYYVIVTNGSSAATSSVATLTVFRAPQIVQQPTPASSVRALGESISYSVGANGATPVSYFWRTNGSVIPGATASTLNLSNLNSNNAATYTVIVSNAFGTATSSPVTLSIVGTNYPYAQQVLADNPIGYWRLDEASGSTAFDSIGTNNGTYNSTQLGQPGYNLVDTHTSARFGFLAPQNSYVGGIPIDFGSAANQSLTVEAWIKGGVPSTDAGLITKGTGAGGEQFNLDCGAGGHAFRFFVRQDDGTVKGANSSVLPSSSQWQHVVGVLNRSAGYVAIYVNGVSNASGSFPTESYRGLLRSANAMTIGSRQGGTGAYGNQFGGYMQDVAVYNYALSPARIQAHYLAASNRAPVFASNPFSKPDATAGQVYSSSISSDASDPNGDAITYSKVSGPVWLGVAPNGALSGTPSGPDNGTNTFVVSATDPAGLSNSATMRIFVVANYTLTYNAGPNGGISGTTPQVVSYGGSGTSVTAVPNTGYAFVNWSDGSTANPRTDVNVTNNITVTANFTALTYTLTYIAGPNGSISGTTPQNVAYGNSGTAVTAVPDGGYAFTNWSDGLTVNPRTDSNVTSNITVTANFVLLPSGGLPEPWTTNAVGSISAITSATYSNGVFMVDGSGSRISGKSDNFWFVNQPATNTATVLARVVSMSGGNSSARAGVMMREDLSTGSRSLFMGLTPSDQAQWVRRSTASGNSSSTTINGRPAPYWVRLTRSGNTFTGYISSDGNSWSQVASANIAIAGNYALGLAVCSGTSGTITTAQFDGVLVTNTTTIGQMPAVSTNNPVNATLTSAAVASDLFNFSITGDSNVIWQLEESTDLQVWNVLQTIGTIDGTVQHSEGNDGQARRFFRLQSTQ